MRHRSAAEVGAYTGSECKSCHLPLASSAGGSECVDMNRKLRREVPAEILELEAAILKLKEGRPREATGALPDSVREPPPRAWILTERPASCFLLHALGAAADFDRYPILERTLAGINDR